MAPGASTDDATSKNLEHQIHDRISRLLSDRIWTGVESLSDIGLAQSLGVSRTPVRMALARLESEGLVRKAPNRGWSPIPVTLKDIQDIFDLKEALESLAVRRACRRPAQVSAEPLLAALLEMQMAAGDADLGRWIAADDSFHACLYHMVSNERLTRSMSALDGQWYRFRMGYLAQEGDLHRLYQEHAAIAAAIAAGDEAGAVAATCRHLGHVRSSILQITRNILMPFMGIAGAPDERDDAGDFAAGSSASVGDDRPAVGQA